jgi:5-(carboxyamino)imidazole ribonucleotide synthase
MLGIFGGGQLGRMMAMAARPLGYHVCAIDPDPSCAARFVLDRCITAGLDDVAAAEDLARSSAVVTVEIEKVGLAALRAAERFAPVRPSSRVLEVVQDRLVQKRWLQGQGFPLAPFEEASSAADIGLAIGKLGPAFIKTRREGYDGKGQARASRTDEAERVWRELAGAPCVVEKALTLEAECSVLVARTPAGAVACYPPALNLHKDGILEWSVLPAPLPPELVIQAVELSRGIAEQLGVVGVVVVELFITADRTLLVNELAPRPHNSFHATDLACVTSQFEQVVRAVCDLPLGTTEVVRPTAICNLLGDLWLTGRPPDFVAALAHSGVRLNLYGKRVARPGRKMGHLAAVGSTPEDALERVKAARESLLHLP